MMNDKPPFITKEDILGNLKEKELKEKQAELAQKINRYFRELEER